MRVLPLVFLDRFIRREVLLQDLGHRRLYARKVSHQFLERIAGIAAKADVSPIEFADRQSILLTNPGLNGQIGRAHV